MTISRLFLTRVPKFIRDLDSASKDIALKEFNRLQRMVNGVGCDREGDSMYPVPVMRHNDSISVFATELSNTSTLVEQYRVYNRWKGIPNCRTIKNSDIECTNVKTRRYYHHECKGI